MISKHKSISLLVQLFDDNKLTFREIALLRQVFDEAVVACNEGRSDIEADYNMGPPYYIIIWGEVLIRNYQANL